MDREDEGEEEYIAFSMNKNILLSSIGYNTSLIPKRIFYNFVVGMHCKKGQRQGRLETENRCGNMYQTDIEYK